MQNLKDGSYEWPHNKLNEDYYYDMIKKKRKKKDYSYDKSNKSCECELHSNDYKLIVIYCNSGI